MLKFSFNLGFLFSFFFLVKFNIILLNEESLILFCFVLFCFLSTAKLGPQVSNYFNEQVSSIKAAVIQSNKEFLELTAKEKNELSRTFTWPLEVSNLKKHFLFFNKAIISRWPQVYLSQAKSTLAKKLIFSHRLEQQVTKLVALVLLEKVKQSVTLQQFCIKKLTLKKFNSLEKMYFREHLAKLN